MARQKGTCQYVCGLNSRVVWVELGFNQPALPETGREGHAGGPGSNPVMGDSRLWDEVMKEMAPEVYLSSTNRVRVTSLHIQSFTEAAKLRATEQNQRKEPTEKLDPALKIISLMSRGWVRGVGKGRKGNSRNAGSLSLILR